MPSERKIKEAQELAARLRDSTVAICTNYTGMPVVAMTALRRALREKGVDYRVVKNTLVGIAADSVGRSRLKEVVHGPTGIAFGYGEPSEAAKALANFIKTSRATMEIRGALLGDRVLTAAEVQQLVELPSKAELVAKLLGQMQVPMASLLYVLNGPLTGLVTVLQRRIEKGA